MIAPYYTDEFVTIYHGDNRDVLPHLPVADVCITDPPYAEQTHTGARTNINMPLIDFDAITMDDVYTLFALLRVKRWYVATMDWRHIAHLEQAPPMGWRFVRFGIWDKPNGAPQFTGDRPAAGWEGIAILHTLGGRMQWNGGGHRAVYRYNKINGEHKTEKPLAFAEKLVTQYSNAGELIIDPYCGTGTTLDAARRLGRRAIGIEMDERWCEAAAKRVAQPFTKRMFAEEAA